MAKKKQVGKKAPSPREDVEEVCDDISALIADRESDATGSAMLGIALIGSGTVGVLTLIATLLLAPTAVHAGIITTICIAMTFLFMSDQARVNHKQWTDFLLRFKMLQKTLRQDPYYRRGKLILQTYADYAFLRVQFESWRNRVESGAFHEDGALRTGYEQLLARAERAIIQEGDRLLTTITLIEELEERGINMSERITSGSPVSIEERIEELNDDQNALLPGVASLEQHLRSESGIADLNRELREFQSRLPAVTTQR